MMKKAIAAVIAALMILPCTGQVCAADEAALSFGDPNGDGSIDAKDASFILAAYSRLSTGEEDVLTAAQSTAADVKTDGNVDAKDASAILAYYSYLSTGGTYTLAVYLGYEEPEKYEYKLENITKSAEVFNYFADQMNNDIFKGATYVGTDFDANEYRTDGIKYAKIALLLLNENENYKDGVLQEVFKNYSDQDIKNGVWYFYNVPTFESACNGNIYFSEYALDYDIGTYMNKIKKALNNGICTSDFTELNEIIMGFYNYSGYEKQYNNIASYYYTIGVDEMAWYYGNAENVDWKCYKDDGNFMGIQAEKENRIKEMIK